jgi:hypothetical protein
VFLGRTDKRTETTNRDMETRRRAVQYWIAIALGLVIPITALLGESSNANVPMNAAALALALMAVTALDPVDLHPWQELGEFGCAAWLIASPFLWEYSGDVLAYWHIMLGLLLALLATYNLWQDREPGWDPPSGLGWP